MVYLEQTIKKRGREWAVLQVDQGNEPAERLYEQLGYRPYHPHFLRREMGTPFSQAIVPLNQANGDSPHIELLIRLRDQEGKMVPPGNFIPAAERFGNMIAILADKKYQEWTPNPNRQAGQHRRWYGPKSKKANPDAWKSLPVIRP